MGDKKAGEWTAGFDRLLAKKKEIEGGETEGGLQGNII